MRYKLQAWLTLTCVCVCVCRIGETRFSTYLKQKREPDWLLFFSTGYIKYLSSLPTTNRRSLYIQYISRAQSNRGRKKNQASPLYTAASLSLSVSLPRQVSWLNPLRREKKKLERKVSGRQSRHDARESRLHERHAERGCIVTSSSCRACTREFVPSLTRGCFLFL